MCEDPVSSKRCETCHRTTCYFHPIMKPRGLDTIHPITIPTFIERFGCGSHIGEILKSCTVWVCKACDDTECRYSIDAINLKHIHPIPCPSNTPNPNPKWVKLGEFKMEELK